MTSYRNDCNRVPRRWRRTILYTLYRVSNSPEKSSRSRNTWLYQTGQTRHESSCWCQKQLQLYYRRKRILVNWKRIWLCFYFCTATNYSEVKNKTLTNVNDHNYYEKTALPLNPYILHVISASTSVHASAHTDAYSPYWLTTTRP